MYRIFLILLLLIPGSLLAQGLKTSPGVVTVVALPATCTAVGAANSSAPVRYQGRVYLCSATNTWSLLSVTGGAISGTTGTFSSLTAGRLVYAGTAGLLSDSAGAFLDSSGNATVTSLTSQGAATNGIIVKGSTNLEGSRISFQRASGFEMLTMKWASPTLSNSAFVLDNVNGNDTEFRVAAVAKFYIKGDGTGVHSVDDVKITTAGKTVFIKTGSNACSGSSTLSSGTVTVSTTCTGTTWGTDFIILLTPRGSSTGALRISTHTAATSFVITSTDAASSDPVGWMIIKQN